jgi:hypothetical protein
LLMMMKTLISMINEDCASDNNNDGKDGMR